MLIIIQYTHYMHVNDATVHYISLYFNRDVLLYQMGRQMIPDQLVAGIP